MLLLTLIAGVPGEKPEKITRFSFQISLYSVVNDEENLTLHQKSVVNDEENLTLRQKSLKALFHTPLQLMTTAPACLAKE